MKWVGLIFLACMVGGAVFVFLSGPDQLRRATGELERELSQREEQVQARTSELAQRVREAEALLAAEVDKRVALEARVEALKAEQEELRTKLQQVTETGLNTPLAPTQSPVDAAELGRLRDDLARLREAIAAKERRLAEGNPRP